jgi:methionine-rich copper-binding protein CopC
VGAKLKAPQAISLLFSEKIEPVFNKIELLDAAGAHFEDGKSTVDGSDKALLHVRLKQLPAGQYSVRWRVSAADTHRMEGSFSFQVVP